MHVHVVALLRMRPQAQLAVCGLAVRMDRERLLHSQLCLDSRSMCEGYREVHVSTYSELLEPALSSLQCSAHLEYAAQLEPVRWGHPGSSGQPTGLRGAGKQDVEPACNAMNHLRVNATVRIYMRLACRNAQKGLSIMWQQSA